MIIQTSLISGLNVILSSAGSHQGYLFFNMTVYSVYFFRDPVSYDDPELESEVTKLFLGLCAWHFLLYVLMVYREHMSRTTKRVRPVMLQTYLVVL